MENTSTELFASYEAELKLVSADITQKLEQIAELSGEARKSALAQVKRGLDEGEELLSQLRLEKSQIPTPHRQKTNVRFRNHETDLDALNRRYLHLTSDRSSLFGARYSDNPSDVQLEQRQQLLSGTDRLDRSSQRLRDSQRLAHETEDIGAGTLADLHRQREVIVHTQDTLLESEGYVDRSVKTLRGMARRMATNRIITVSIIAILVILIMIVIINKFR